MLLGYTQSTIARELRAEMAAHLDACDFCDAELYLLTMFPPVSAVRCTPVKIPRPLYHLAKELFAASTQAAERTVELLYDREKLSFTDA